MRPEIDQIIQGSKLKTLDCSTIENQIYKILGEEYTRLGGYAAFARLIKDLCTEEVLEPVKTSGTNGRNPFLYNRYRKVTKGMEEELRLKLLGLHPLIKSEAYRKSPLAYGQDEKYLAALDVFLKDPRRRCSLQDEIAVNERSFEIFRDEKFLLSDKGRLFLQRTGLTLAGLSCYLTTEPFFYVDYRRQLDNAVTQESVNQNNDCSSNQLPSHLLIVENKDTFYSLKKAWQGGRRNIGGIEFDLLIYGEGRKIVSSFAFIQELQGLTPENMHVYYFGDLDLEGIDIFGSLALAFAEYRIEPCIYCYQMLVQLYSGDAPRVRDKVQKLRLEFRERFLRCFHPDVARQIEVILDGERYIPQEGLDYTFFVKESWS